jgi:hypothetical protein
MAKPAWKVKVVRLTPEWQREDKLQQVLNEHLGGEEEFLQIIDSEPDWLLIYREPERKPGR